MAGRKAALSDPKEFSVERWLGFGAFVALGFSIGIWQITLPDLTSDLRLSPAALGTALAIGFSAILPATLLSGTLADRWGPNRLLSFGGTGIAVASALLTAVNSFTSLTIVLVLFWAANGMYRVGCNSAGARLQPLYGPRLLVQMHATGSAAAAAGVLFAAFWLMWGLPFRWLYLVMASAYALEVLAVGRHRSPASAPEGSSGAAGVPPTTNQVIAGFAVISLLVLGIMATERSAQDWFGLYLSKGLALPALTLGVALAGMHLAMAAGRFAAPAYIARVGRQGVLIRGGLLVATGMTVALMSESPVVVIAGLTLLGLGIAPAWPITVSFARDVSPARSGRALSATMSLGYVAGFLQPILSGTVASAYSLRGAMILVVGAGILVAATSLLLPQRLKN